MIQRPRYIHSWSWSITLFSDPANFSILTQIKRNWSYIMRMCKYLPNFSGQCIISQNINLMELNVKSHSPMFGQGFECEAFTTNSPRNHVPNLGGACWVRRVCANSTNTVPPKMIHMARVWLCVVVVWYHSIATVPVKQLWRIWVEKSLQPPQRLTAWLADRHFHFMINDTRGMNEESTSINHLGPIEGTSFYLSKQRPSILLHSDPTLPSYILPTYSVTLATDPITPLYWQFCSQVRDDEDICCTITFFHVHAGMMPCL